MLIQHLILSDRLSRSTTVEETNNPRISTTFLDNGDRFSASQCDGYNDRRKQELYHLLWWRKVSPIAL